MRLLGTFFLLHSSLVLGQVPGPQPHVYEKLVKELFRSEKKPFCSNLDFPEDLRKIVVSLQKTIEEGLYRTDKNPPAHYQGGEPHYKKPPFDGNVDWHSAVHGYWALLSISRLLGQDKKREKLISELTPERLRYHMKALRDNRKKTPYPYGWNWLLILVDELQKGGGYSDPKLLVEMRKELEQWMNDWLKNRAIPDALINARHLSEYSSIPKSTTAVDNSRLRQSKSERGEHFSWPLHVFLSSLTYPRDDASDWKDYFQFNVLRNLKVSEAYRKGHAFDKLKDYKSKSFDFVHVPSVWELIRLAIFDVQQTDRGKDLRSFDDMEKEERVFRSEIGVVPFRILKNPSAQDAHNYGIVISNLWLLGMKARRDLIDCEVFKKRLLKIISVPRIWQSKVDKDGDRKLDDNLYEAAHWTPQMIWLAIMLARGDL